MESPGASRAFLGPGGLGEFGDRLEGHPRGTEVYLPDKPSLSQSRDTEVLCRSRCLGPGGSRRSPFPSTGCLASLSPPGHLFIYPQGPKLERSIPARRIC